MLLLKINEFYALITMRYRESEQCTQTGCLKEQLEIQNAV